MVTFAHPNASAPDVDQFNGDCKTNDSTMTAQSWHFVGISFFFEGTDTVVEIFQDGTTAKSYDAVKLFFEDSYDSTHTWLMMARQKDSSNVISGENPWSGYMYNFVLYNTQMTLANILDSSVYGNNCPTGCSICPGHNLCLWEAGIDQYIDDSGIVLDCDCSWCDSDYDNDQSLCYSYVPGNGCVRDTDCNLCDDRLCATCKNFDANLSYCEACLTNASGNTDSTECQCDVDYLWDEVTNNCQGCHPACDTCSDFTQLTCPTCNPGYFKQVDADFCFNYCPSGYDASSQSCTLSTELILEFDFVEVDITPENTGLSPYALDSADGGSTPAYLRGHYFSSSQNGWKLDNSAADLKMHHSYTVIAWIRRDNDNSQMCLFSKTDASDETLLSFYITSLRTLSLQWESNDGSENSFETASNTVSTTNWNQVAVNAAYDETANQTTVNLYVNQSTESSTFSNAIYMDDSSGNKTTIGYKMEYDNILLTTSKGCFYNGYIYELQVYNVEKGSSGAIVSRVASGCESDACTFCPNLDSSPSTCINTCPLDDLPPNCDDCESSCTNCRHSDNCELCTNALCTKCNTFASDSVCTDCVQFAQLNGSNTCECDSEHVQIEADTCGCSSECVRCTADNEYNCLECQTGGYYLQSGSTFCFNFCGVGYSISDVTCTGSDTRIKTDYSTFEVSRAVSDPWPAKDRGQYFNGSDSWLSGTTRLHYIGTLDFFIRPTDLTRDSTLYSINSDTSPGSTQFTFYIKTTGLLSLDFNASKIDDGTSAQQSVQDTDDAISDNAWVWVSVDWSYATSTTTIDLKVNGSSVHSESLSGFIVEDNANFSHYIGYKDLTGVGSGTDRYLGFMYQSGISNYVANVASLVATSGCVQDGTSYACSTCPIVNGSDNCLSMCDIDQYPVRGGDCQSCDGSCTQGCVRAENCYLCYDYHCEACDTFVSAECLTCELPGIVDSPSNCYCTDNINANQLTRSTVEEPCCATRCGSCTEPQYYQYCTSCSSGYEQPTTSGTTGTVCFTDCPSGYSTAVSVGDPCTASIEGLIIQYDLTQIAGNIVNDANNGVWEGSMGSSHGFQDTKPYKLRGAWSDGLSNGQAQAIFISNLNLHHTFSMSVWIWQASSPSRPSTIFSKDKGIGSNAGDENLVEIQTRESERIGIQMYAGGVDKFIDSTSFPSGCQTGTSTYTIKNWFHLHVTIQFDGKDTAAEIFMDRVTSTTCTAESSFLEDKDSYANAWLFMSTQKDDATSNAESENPFNGFMYDFNLYNRLATTLEGDAWIASTCSGTCAICPADRATCLWDTEVSNFGQDDATACDAPCGTDGCVREEDCNLCDDRLCQTCLNFDSDVSICSQCISDASGAPSTICECDSDYYFAEGTSTCTQCPTECATCTNSHTGANKECLSCETGYEFLPTIGMCTPDCPTGSAANGSNECEYPTTDPMLDLTLQNWSIDFNTVYDNTSDLIEFQRGTTTTYDSADPWLSKRTDRYQFYFDGSDDCMVTVTNSIILNHSMTVTIWMYLVDNGQTYNTPLTVGASDDHFECGLESRLPYLEFKEADTTAGSSTIYSVSAEAGSEISLSTWSYVAWTLEAVDFSSSNVFIYKDGVEIKYQALNESYSDLTSSSIHVGCSVSSVGSLEQFFGGYIFEIIIRPEIYTASDFTTDISTQTPTLPDNSGLCDYNEFVNVAGCSSCDEVCTSQSDGCEYAHTSCTICSDVKCVKCDNYQCKSCMTGAALSGTDPDTCECFDGYYEDDNGKCVACSTGCATCTSGDIWHCQSCSSGYYLQDSSSTCQAFCPSGWVQSTDGSNSCITFDGTDFSIVFQHVKRTFTLHGVEFTTGIDTTEDSSDPYLYRSRGLYLGGSADMFRTSGDLGLKLSPNLSMMMIFYTSTSSGCLFNQAKASSFSNQYELSMFDVTLESSGTIRFSLNNRNSDPTTFAVTHDISSAYTVNQWNYFGFTLTIDTNINTEIKAFINGGAGATSTFTTPITLLENQNAITGLGACFTAGASDNISNYMTGWYYQWSLKMIEDDSWVQDFTNTSTCPADCSAVCPKYAVLDLVILLTECLITCTREQYWDGTSCVDCTDCMGLDPLNPHPQSFKGCAHASCNVCYDQECGQCSHFWADGCTSCVTDSNANPTACDCSAETFYDASTHSCQSCDASCEVCTDSTKYTCSQCDDGEGYYLQPGVTWCTHWCPTGY